MTTTHPPSSQLDRGRGALILVLGILSLVMFGLLTGIPAWIMGHTDLRRMREGSMERADEGLTRAGMILGIIGTVLSALALLIIILVIVGILSFAGIMIFETAAIKMQERAIEAHLHALAREASAWRLERGTYEGFTIPDELKDTDHESYSARVSRDEIMFRGSATNRRGSIEVTMDRDGNLTDWSYFGAFAEHDRTDFLDRIVHFPSSHSHEQHSLLVPFARVVYSI
ncbi:MAG: DUF4190 domain-containing protein [Ignavibacteriales bacterium]|nr:DUF4190 domain-containing protein [Ignavibacteriales bacterium]